MTLELDSAIDLFLDHIKVERGLSRNTVLAYAQDLARFRDHCERQGFTDAAAIKASDVLAYLIELSRARLSPRSQTRNLVTLRGLYRRLLAENLADRPVAHVAQAVNSLVPSSSSAT